ncbi:MAG: GNAT family N-acetyltransferase [Acidaminobacter sp.]|uniref:GNAT family N-acetyltransferase n=1 Tax=Acidaminobacter sp. TaxID=1872102 RepID=UPI00137EB728|nr:GNAT family N-acetyltransferase [Acidaminobacter sp.]MZQ97752.1 GNAT family N-acetyltransferase [Acidaminobacter sp.]
MNVTIRPIEARDAREINAIRRMPGVFENILGLPSERVDRSEGFIAGLDSNSHQLVATRLDEEGRELVVGTAGIVIGVNPRLRHTAMLGIMIHRDYQNQGIGKKMMEALLDLSDNWLMLIRVELAVYTDNERAIGLYKKMGFEIEGTRKKAAIRGGDYVDEFIMARLRA